MQLRAIIAFHVLWRPRREARLICSHDWMPAADLPVSFYHKASCASELGMYAQVIPDDVWPSWSMFLTAHGHHDGGHFEGLWQSSYSSFSDKGANYGMLLPFYGSLT